MTNDFSLLVVDQAPDLAEELRRACRRAGLTVLGPVPTAGEAAEAVAQGAVDVVLVELDGPPDPTLSLIAELTATIPAVRILGVATHPEPELTAATLGSGACGLIPRPIAATSLRAAVQHAASGALVVPDHDLAAIVARIDVARRAACGIDTLTDREREVLRSLAEGRATAEIAVQLGISPMTVQSHVKNVLAKLGVHSKMEAVRLAWREGLAGVAAGV